ncbi:hypothetical protein Cni_G13545 [Canna indica]|uniref:EF-hand domain-containing protein n=1 Tax=Canna indica TaxID=4628 RepID=A0AAQ3KCT3_9LILI|nr:hypothetical protein Cni_G13545 [Canna indica]
MTAAARHQSITDTYPLITLPFLTTAPARLWKLLLASRSIFSAASSPPSLQNKYHAHPKPTHRSQTLGAFKSLSSTSLFDITSIIKTRGNSKSSTTIMDLDSVFRSFDKDGDGKISAAELTLCMENAAGAKLSPEEADALVEMADGDGDGLLDLEEFKKLVEAEGEEEKERDLIAAFKMYENEGEGCITPKSLKRMLSRLGLSTDIDECRSMIWRFDLNGDGVLSFEEFRVVMTAV